MTSLLLTIAIASLRATANYTSDPTGRTTCALIVESDGTAPSEYRLRWHSGEGDYREVDYEHLELKRGVCRWELRRMK